eukprot:8549754-Alexandrium_andersonii.AAC.1
MPPRSPVSSPSRLPVGRRVGAQRCLALCCGAPAVRRPTVAPRRTPSRPDGRVFTASGTRAARPQ